jgi:hypothetical protein
LNQTFGKDMMSLLAKDRVLETPKLTSIVTLIVAIRAQGQRLAPFPSCVDDIDVVQLEVVTVRPQSSCSVIVFILLLILSHASRDGDFVSTIVVATRRADDGDVLFVHKDLLLVSPWLDEYCFSRLRVIHSSLDCFEVFRDYYGSGWRS